MSQETSCRMPGEFVIHQHPEGLLKTTNQISENSSLNIAPQQNIGKFNQNGFSWICCCSFKPIRSLELQMYGQRLSISTCESSCCLNVCNCELVVSAMNKVLIGKVKKGCWGCSGPFLVVEDQTGKQIFEIRADCCQWANVCPRLFRCTSEVVYVIFGSDGREVGRIVNMFRSCGSSIFCLRDDFEISFELVQGEKEKILLLNAVVLINQLKHELF